MKTVFKSSRPARDGESRSSFNQKISPAIRQNYQVSAPVLRGAAGSFHPVTRASLAGFRAISSVFFDAEAKREFRLEAGAFAIITALALWPMVQAVEALIGQFR